MVPAAAERAATLEGGHDSIWEFPRAPGALLTDWAWYLRAATLTDAAVGAGGVLMYWCIGVVMVCGCVGLLVYGSLF